MTLQDPPMSCERSRVWQLLDENKSLHRTGGTRIPVGQEAEGAQPCKLRKTLLREEAHCTNRPALRYELR